MSPLVAPTRSVSTQAESARDPSSDGALLTQFIRQRREAAFEELVRRHGQLVFAVALRVLRDRHAAEDVFQATFLVLAQNARRLRQPQSVASWLHGTALRLAKKALLRCRRSQELEGDVPCHRRRTALDEISTRYAQQVLDEELSRLPVIYREALVRHYLEGRTCAEAADLLGVSVGTIEGRVKRGKRELQLRLMRRGVGLGIALTATSWSQALAQSTLSTELIQAATAGGIAIQQGTPLTANCSPEAVHLALQETGMLTTGHMICMTSAATVLAMAGLVAGGLPSNPPHSDATGPVNTTVDIPAQPVAQVAQLGEQPRRKQGKPAGNSAKSAHEAHTPSEGQKRSGELEMGMDPAELEKRIKAHRLGEKLAGNSRTDLIPVQSGLSESEKKISEALDQSIEMEFVDTPLRDSMDYLSQGLDITIVLDENALSETGNTPDSPVNLVVHGITLRSGLNLLLEQLSDDLTYLIEDEVLKITSVDKADSHFETRIYDVQALEINDRSVSELTEVVKRTTSGPWAPQAPMMFGGTSGGFGGGQGGFAGGEAVTVPNSEVGNIETYENFLVVRQTQKGHLEVERLLNQLATLRVRQSQEPGTGGTGGGFFSIAPAAR